MTIIFKTQNNERVLKTAREKVQTTYKAGLLVYHWTDYIIQQKPLKPGGHEKKYTPNPVTLQLSKQIIIQRKTIYQNGIINKNS